MKKLFITIFLIAVSSSAYSQNMPEEQVPSLVKDKLYADFKATDVTWEMEDNMYEASYLEEQMEKSVIINVEGIVIAVETQIDPANLPQPALNYISEFYQGAQILEAEFIQTKDANFYKAEINHNGSIIELIFDESGNFQRLDNPESGKDPD